MKKILLAIAIAFTLSSKAQDVDDGWYRSTVKYTNYGTGTYATYTLNVKVRYNKVVTIDFGNGGSVHSGYNNEGYIYSGGNLTLDTDYLGNASAYCNVTVYESDGGAKYFKITIE